MIHYTFYYYIYINLVTFGRIEIEHVALISSDLFGLVMGPKI